MQNEPTFLTRSDVGTVIDMLLPSFGTMAKRGFIKDYKFHIVVSNPRATLNDIEAGIPENCFLYERSFGEDPRYTHIARSKTLLSMKQGLPTQIIHTRAPFLLCEQDTIWYGSAISDGLIVGVSGLKAYHDQMIASWVLEGCRAISIEHYEHFRTNHDDRDFASH